MAQTRLLQEPGERVVSALGPRQQQTRSAPSPALPEEVLAILNDGGLIPHGKKMLAARA